MTYCTTTELINLTGTSLTNTELTEIITQADREIDARLGYYAVTGVEGDPNLKGASLHLSKAIILSRLRLHQDSYAPVEDLRKTAYEMIDSYIWASLDEDDTPYVVKVNG